MSGEDFRTQLRHPVEGLTSGERDRYTDGYTQGLADAEQQHQWMQDKAWQDAVLMLVHYQTLAERTWLVGHEEAAAKLAEWWKRVKALAETKSVEEIAASPKATATAGVRDAIRAEIINTPETADFMAGVPLEAAHQRERWGVSHDGGKTPFDWFWLIGYLAQKAASAQVAGDAEKALHHTISTAAALANWHAQIAGCTDMRPGIGPDNGGEKPGSAYALAATLTDSGTAATIGGERVAIAQPDYASLGIDDPEVRN